MVIFCCSVAWRGEKKNISKRLLVAACKCLKNYYYYRYTKYNQFFISKAAVDLCKDPKEDSKLNSLLFSKLPNLKYYSIWEKLLFWLSMICSLTHCMPDLRWGGIFYLKSWYCESLQIMFKSWYYLQPSSFYIVIHLHKDVEVSISLWAERPHLSFYSLAGLLDQEVLHLTLCGLSHHILNSSITVFAKKKKKALRDTTLRQ